MAECYPQGCPPCTEEISFPENPINGQRECFHIGKDPNTGEDILKCWVYDQCVPGWRAEGPSAAPINFKGQLDLTKTEAENGITVKEAGDYYIVAVASQTQQFLTDEWLSLQHEVSVGAFVLWTGTEWVEIPRPCGEQADCALDMTPDPDVREAGTVIIASKEEVCAGVSKCNVVTPYTLKECMVDFTPTKPDPNNGVTAVITQGDDYVQCINDTTLVLNVVGSATAIDGSTAIGRWKYQWSENDVDLRKVRVETVSGGSTDTLTIEDFEIIPVTGTRTFKVVATFTDLFGEEFTAEDTINVTLTNATRIVIPPKELDLTANASGNFSVTTNSITGDLPAPNLSYKWYVNNVEITGANVPDIGYTFVDFGSAVLNVTRTAADAGTYSIYVEITGGCQGMLVSDSVFLKGPGGEDGAVIVQPLPGTAYGSIGSYTLFSDNANLQFPAGQQLNQLGLGSEFIPVSLAPQRWRVMGVGTGFNAGADQDGAGNVLAVRIA